VTTATETKPESKDSPDDGTTDKDGERFHYVRKEDIARSAVTGKHVVALCGETFPVTKLPKPSNPVCTECQRIYDRMKK
jgi:hypothetical protein